MARRVPGLWLRGKIWWIHYYDQHGRRHFERVGPSHRRAVRARATRLAEIEAGRFGLRQSRKIPTLREFVEGPWRREVAIGLKPSTLRGYEMAIRVHLLAEFGNSPLTSITRATVKAFIARKWRQQRASRCKHDPNPNRPTLSHKSIRNMVAILASILEIATVDYELLPTNPLRGILRRKNFPADASHPTDRRPRVLEPQDFARAVNQLASPTLQMVLVAALTGLRWGELVALRIDEDMDYRRNKIHVTRSLFKRIPQTLKTDSSLRSVDMCPAVRRIFNAIPRKEGLVFSPDGTTPIGDGSWLKRQWLQAQRRAGIKRPIRWHDLRHEFVSLLIAAGKPVKYIADQAGHASAGFTLDRYGHLFETIISTQVQWPENLLWPRGSQEVTSSENIKLVDASKLGDGGEEGCVVAGRSNC